MRRTSKRETPCRAKALAGFAETVDELVGLAANCRIEDERCVRIVCVSQQGGFAFEPETSLFQFRANRGRIDPVKGI
jgi:hypothetical protein